MTLEINDQPFRVVGEILTLCHSLWIMTLAVRCSEFLHVKPGKGAAFVRSKLKNCITGGVVDKTFRAGEVLNTADVQRLGSQLTYMDGGEVHLRIPFPCMMLFFSVCIHGHDVLRRNPCD